MAFKIVYQEMSLNKFKGIDNDMIHFCFVT